MSTFPGVRKRRALQQARRRFDGVGHRPAADDAIERENDEAGNHPHAADGDPHTALQRLERTDRIAPGGAADGEFRQHNAEPDGQDEPEINDQKDGAAVLADQIREFPDISQSHGGPGGGQNESQPGAEMPAISRHGVPIC